MHAHAHLGSKIHSTTFFYNSCPEQKWYHFCSNILWHAPGQVLPWTLCSVVLWRHCKSSLLPPRLLVQGCKQVDPVGEHRPMEYTDLVLQNTHATHGCSLACRHARVHAPQHVYTHTHTHTYAYTHIIRTYGTWTDAKTPKCAHMHVHMQAHVQNSCTEGSGNTVCQQQHMHTRKHMDPTPELRHSYDKTHTHTQTKWKMCTVHTKCALDMDLHANIVLGRQTFRC